MQTQKPTIETEMMDALQRSGYIFESEMAAMLSRIGFFVETNQVVLDATTGKSREIDIMAEYFESNLERINARVAASIKFVFELKNNNFPVVLLTGFKKNPAIELWQYLKVGNTGELEPDPLLMPDYYDHLLENSKLENTLFTQYCSFQRKKENRELMALHPDELYSGINKISGHCESKAEIMNAAERSNKLKDYYRNFLYLPVVLLKNDLYELHQQSGKRVKLKKVKVSKMIFNYHYNDNPRGAVVYFVTQKGLMTFLKKMVVVQRKIELQMLALRKKNDSLMSKRNA